VNNGLPQGSVLAPLLFNLVISDTRSTKFCYADDIALVYRAKDLDQTETTLTEDLASLCSYTLKSGVLNPVKAKLRSLCISSEQQTGKQRAQCAI